MSFSLMILMTSQFKGGRSKPAVYNWVSGTSTTTSASELTASPSEVKHWGRNNSTQLLAWASSIQEWLGNSPCHISTFPFLSSSVTCALLSSHTVNSQLAHTTHSAPRVRTPQLKPRDWGKTVHDCARKEEFPLTNIL